MCKHPLKGFPVDITENGKPKYKIVPYGTDHIELFKGNWINCFTSFKSPYAEKCVTTFTEIPCGKCIDCKLQYSRQWADRCIFESSYYKETECWFLTITYDDDHIMDVGSDLFAGTLLKKELSAFIKNLRRQIEYHGYGDGIRFYACGEYGSKTFRPHYHMILYGLDLKKFDNLEYWVKTKSGYCTWRSPLLEKIWKNGMIVVSPISWDTCAYTARYVLKKANGITPDHYIANGVEPEFVLMSRRPGIGRQYFDDNYENIYRTDEVFIKSADGGRKGKPPKYYDSLYEKINPDNYKRIKENRRSISERVRQLKLEKTGLSFKEILEIEENILNNKLKLLPRS